MEQKADLTTGRVRLWNTNYTLVWIANFMLYFSFMLLVPLFPLYLRDTFGADKEMIGWVLSGYTIAALVVRPFSGWVVDSFPRKTVLLLCYFFVMLMFAGYLAAGSLTMFALFRTLHGAPFGATTVASTTVAIDVLAPSRRAEGIGYFGLANNFATAISPTIAIFLLHAFGNNYDLLFLLSLIVSFIGVVIVTRIRMPKKNHAASVNDSSDLQADGAKTPAQSIRVVSLDRFILLKAWREGLCMLCYSFSYGVIATYLAIYGEEELGIKGGTGLFFLLLASGLALSRLTGAKGLRQGRVSHNAAEGVVVSLFGYFLFAALHNPFGFYGAALIIGLGNGHMYPAFQNMFINLAPNSQRGTATSTLLTSWDIGVGIGVLVGGVAAEQINYHAAFWIMWIVNLLGVSMFFLFARKHYDRNKLR